MKKRFIPILALCSIMSLSSCHIIYVMSFSDILLMLILGFALTLFVMAKLRK